eukprot:TRINITY_DN6462_c0_g1_i1.p1 TRINITY_DN6462_c0_g1~~TRINITY_DN6462_c0_g1_i1.p1  ORF type:complete len:167 (+),score=40.24 TRINITY_DN6462_c0_g1_i1:43-543(+)
MQRGVVAVACLVVAQSSAFVLLPRSAAVARPAATLAAIPVTFITPAGEEKVVSIEPGTSLLVAAEGADIEAPFSCRAGLCTECAGMVVQGGDNVHLEAAVLDPEVTAQGFVLTCSATVTGEGVVIQLGAGEAMYEAQYGGFRRDHEAMQSKKSGFNSIPLSAQEAA